jgi:hypothetical protein
MGEAYANTQGGRGPGKEAPTGGQGTWSNDAREEELLSIIVTTGHYVL